MSYFEIPIKELDTISLALNSIKQYDWRGKKKN